MFYDAFVRVECLPLVFSSQVSQNQRLTFSALEYASFFGSLCLMLSTGVRRCLVFLTRSISTVWIDHSDRVIDEDRTSRRR